MLHTLRDRILAAFPKINVNYLKGYKEDNDMGTQSCKLWIKNKTGLFWLGL